MGNNDNNWEHGTKQNKMSILRNRRNDLNHTIYFRGNRKQVPHPLWEGHSLVVYNRLCVACECVILCFCVCPQDTTCTFFWCLEKAVFFNLGISWVGFFQNLTYLVVILQLSTLLQIPYLKCFQTPPSWQRFSTLSDSFKSVSCYRRYLVSKTFYKTAKSADPDQTGAILSESTLFAQVYFSVNKVSKNIW